MYKVELTRQAIKDAAKVEAAGLKEKAAEIIKIVRENCVKTRMKNHKDLKD
jgi:hypothetical protein